jgi:hypothetical protein
MRFLTESDHCGAETTDKGLKKRWRWSSLSEKDKDGIDWGECCKKTDIAYLHENGPRAPKKIRKTFTHGVIMTYAYNPHMTFMISCLHTLSTYIVYNESRYVRVIKELIVYVILI